MNLQNVYIFFSGAFEINRDNLVPSWHEVRGENKKDPYLHTRITGNTKKRTAHVRLKMSRAYV